MSNELTEGTLFAGRYRVIRKIAAGGMGAVYEVEHLETERHRALKVMHAHLFQNDDMCDRFKREAKVAARVNSEFIVDVFDAGVDETTQMPFLVMELLEGEELGKRIKRGGPLPSLEAVTYLYQVARALDKTHKVSIIHRDLKPDNVFLVSREEGLPQVKVLDYGIAKVMADGATGAVTANVVGTPLYMAPEQLNPRLRQTSATDVYALGMMAYTCLVGVPYWAEEAKGGSLLALIAVSVYGPKEPASERASRHGVSLPPAFDPWFARITSSDPISRFPTAIKAVAALADALGVTLGTEGGRAFLPSLSGPPEHVAQAQSDREISAQSTTPTPASSPATVSSDVTISGATATYVMVPKRSKAPMAIAMSLGVLVVVSGGLIVLSSSSVPEPTIARSDSGSHAALMPSMSSVSTPLQPLASAADMLVVAPVGAPSADRTPSDDGIPKAERTSKPTKLTSKHIQTSPQPVVTVPAKATFRRD